MADYEQILTHKAADIIKYCILLLAVGGFACTLYLPIGFGFVFCSYAALSASIVLSVRSWLLGVLDPAALILLIMLLLFVAKMNMTLFIALTAYRNPTISRDKISGIFSEKEEPETSRGFRPQNAKIPIHDVDFSYVDGEPVLQKACRLAGCDGFIRAMEHGFDTEIGENGIRLSGGERQRLSVARAILKDSPIILLDEDTASLDIENELLLLGGKYADMWAASQALR